MNTSRQPGSSPRQAPRAAGSTHRRLRRWAAAALLTAGTLAVPYAALPAAAEPQPTRPASPASPSSPSTATRPAGPSTPRTAVPKAVTPRPTGAVVVSPRAGAVLSSNTVRLVVRAGNEAADVVAQLNGVEIGRHFARDGKGRRSFEASAATGLRPGRNTFTARVHEGTTTRNATIGFTVVTLSGLVGAGLDLRSPVGSQVDLRGVVTGHRSTHPSARTRWRLISAPANSTYAKQTARPRLVVDNEIPVADVSVPLKGSGAKTAPATAFRPDVTGRYVLELTSAGLGRASDTVTVTAVPRDPVLDVDTRATTAGGVPGIRLGSTVYGAPPMGSTGSTPIWSTATSPTSYSMFAMWQLMAVDRATLTVLTDSSGQPWNRTYGLCDYSEGTSGHVCRASGNGPASPADLAADLAGLTSATTLVLASSQRFATPIPSRFWGPPDVDGVASTNFPAIGFPAKAPRLADSAAGEVSLIGTAGLSAGQGSFTIDPGGTGRMSGYLVADQNDLFHFQPADRLHFDTNRSTTCAAGACTLTQSFGTTMATAAVPEGQGGYVVSLVRSHHLGLRDVRAFVTTDDPDGSQASGMASFIAAANPASDLVTVTAIKTSGLGDRPMVDPKAPAAAWADLAAAVEAAGGTRDRFNRSVTTGSGAYSLLGWGGAGATRGVETSDHTNRLRGSLVPDRTSQFRPRDHSAVSDPADQLARLVVREPVTSWPLDDQPGPRAALKAIGASTGTLGDTPRQAYWTQDFGDPSVLSTALRRVGDYRCDSGGSYGGQSFTAADCTTAQKQLTTELGWVGTVWDYTQLLAKPAAVGASGSAWAQSQALYDQLKQDLDQMDANAQTYLQWLDIVGDLLTIVGLVVGLGEVELLADVIEGMAAAYYTAGDLANGNFSGAGGDELPVQADQIAAEIAHQAEAAEDGWQQVRTMIVSDPTKLAEVGTYAFCDDNDNGCGPNGKYAEFALDDDAQQMTSSLAQRSIDRVLYQRLVPLAFPVWKTGPSSYVDVTSFYWCFADVDDPFHDNPPADASAQELRAIDPASPGVTPIDGSNANVWAYYLMVARSSLTFSFPDQSPTLNTMVKPLDPGSGPSSDDYGLAIRQVDLLPYSSSIYDIPGDADCGWTDPVEQGGTGARPSPGTSPSAPPAREVRGAGATRR